MTQNERQKLIYQLEDLREYCNSMKEIWENDIMALDKVIHELETNRWIPVNEKLPSRDKRTQNLSEDVQVTIKNEFGIVVDIDYYDYAEKKWRTEIYGDGKVLAWKPLPQPYNDLCNTNSFDDNKFGGC